MDGPVAADSPLLRDIVGGVLGRAGDGWAVETGSFWCLVTPPGSPRRAQGWKLHLSATLLAAPLVLARAGEVLVRERCRFKFARGLTELSGLLSNRCDRARGGKFITAYPVDDEQFRRLASELDRATDGLPGPVILSDRRLHPTSLVHYRYGVFDASPVLTNDGVFESRLTAPDGAQVPDRRLARFAPPSWANSPLDDGEPTTGGADAPAAPILIADRFEVELAIRHSYRGGVFRARDRHSGREVVLKQARPHVMAERTGRDARDALRHEAAMLELVAACGHAPAPIALVSHQDNLFLAEELIAGETLRRWVTRRATTEWRGRGAPAATAISQAGQLIRMLTDLHGYGLVLRDLNPNNVMVQPDGRLRLVDLEHAVVPGTRVARAFTAGYAAPEQIAAPPYGPAPQPSADLFSLGALLVFLASGVDPVADPGERLAAFVDLLADRVDVLRQLVPLIEGVTHDDPLRRCGAGQALHALHGVGPEPQPSARPRESPTGQADRLIADGLRYLSDTMTPRAPRLWPTTAFGATTDPVNVQEGAAGVLAVLTRAALMPEIDAPREAVAEAARWIAGRLDAQFTLPGLYFGRAGTAWALHDAAGLLGDRELAARATALAGALPRRWPNPDICHGSAGAGLALLHLGRATGDAGLAGHVTDLADGVLDAARERAGRLVWPVPEAFESKLAGTVHYGFAHGVAGAGAFLLYAAAATGRSDYLDAARKAGETLRAVAIVEDGAAWWPVGDTEPRPRVNWCSGSSGVGTFLIRLWRHTGDDRWRELAEAAAAAVSRGRWYSTTCVCHGLAGDGEFLLDLADAIGEPRYREWAGDLVRLLYVRRVRRDGLDLVPDESGAQVSAGYGTGLSGVLGFLLRFRHGGPRLWMPDEVLHHERG